MLLCSYMYQCSLYHSTPWPLIIDVCDWIFENQLSGYIDSVKKHAVLFESTSPISYVYRLSTKNHPKPLYILIGLGNPCRVSYHFKVDFSLALLQHNKEQEVVVECRAVDTVIQWLRMVDVVIRLQNRLQCHTTQKLFFHLSASLLVFTGSWCG